MTNLSPREREVLSIIRDCGIVGRVVLAQELESRMPDDEVEIILRHLHQERRLIAFDGTAISLTPNGARALREEATRG